MHSTALPALHRLFLNTAATCWYDSRQFGSSFRQRTCCTKAKW